MPISLPPPLPPQLAELHVIQESAEPIGEAEYRGYHLHVSGPQHMRWLPLHDLMATANSLSDAIYRVGSSAYAAGYPAAQAFYAVDGQDIYVLLVLGHVTHVEGDPRLTAFFADAVGKEPLRTSQIERDRMLASPHADRLGLKATPLLQAEGEGAYALHLDAKRGAGVEMLRADLSNAGNRYVGRYLGGLGVTVADPAGDQFDLGAHRGIPRWNDPGAQYNDQSLRVSRATTVGAFSAFGQHVTFERPVSDFDTNNLLWQYGATWLWPTYADLRHRRTVQLGVDRVERSTDVSGTTLLDESYTSAQFSVNHSIAFYPRADRRTSVDYGITLRKGFGEHDPAQSNANLAYFLARPAFSLGYKAASPLRLRFDGLAQFSGDVVPEEQQWVIGGSGSLTAYVPGVGLGDSGYTFRFESRWEQPDTVTPRAFVEYSQARLHTATAEQPHHAVSAADAGVALDVTRSWYRASLAYAKPFADKGFLDSTRDASRVHLLFSVQLTIR